jgi:hypothetical protein
MDHFHDPDRQKTFCLRPAKRIVSEWARSAPFLLLNYRDTRRFMGQNAKRITTNNNHNRNKDTWMDDIKAAGIAPFLITLESDVSASMEFEREQYWIEYYLALGASLTNIAHGPRAAHVEVETDYITAYDASVLLSLKMGRKVQPGYIHKLRDVRYVSINHTMKLYHKGDVEQATIRQRRAS